MLDLSAARRWAVASRSLLSDSRERIDRLNVFPVPDGDTGTNMFLTVDGALAELRVIGAADDGSPGALVPVRLSDGLARLARGMLLSARGNSGVILSQLARGMSEAVQAADPDAESMSASVLADAYARAADVAWAGVSNPIEGTILSVARAAAQGASGALADVPQRDDGSARAADPDGTYAVSVAALDAARAALARTPEQLPSLARAGVVDAGGAGFVLVLEALESVLADRAHDGSPRSAQDWDNVASLGGIGRGANELSTSGSAAEPGMPVACEPGEDGYEVMYVLRCDAAGAQQVRHQLVGLGSSVMVVGGPQIWRVHVHLDHTADALAAGSRVGDVQQVTITSLQAPLQAPGTRLTALPLAVVCCAPGPGLARLFASAGARVVHSAAGNRASTGALLQAAQETGASVVAMLPNDGDTVLAARAAAAEGARQGCDIRVVPTVAAVQGLAALSLWDEGRSQTLDAMLAEMTEVAQEMSYGAVVTATAAANTPVGPCHPGDWLGLVRGRIVSVGQKMEHVAGEVLARLAQLHDAEAEVLTVVAGEGHAETGLDAVLATFTQAHADLDVRRLWGGQRTYSWLLGLE